MEQFDKNLIQLRASGLADFVSDPLVYYKNFAKENVVTKAMQNGIDRESISYKIFEDFTKCKEYDAQKEGVVKGEGWVITCHADIVAGKVVYDIKNSIRKDDELVKDYWYQLNAYAVAFDCDKAFLFVDTNEGTNTDTAKCRLVEIPVDKNKFMQDVNNAVAFLKTLSYQEAGEATKSNSKIATMIKRLGEIKSQQNALELEAKDLQKQLEKSMKNYYSYQSGDYVCTKTYRRDIQYETIKTAKAWNGTYKETIAVKPVSKK